MKYRCKWCGREFEGYTYGSKGYCSRQCQREAEESGKKSLNSGGSSSIFSWKIIVILAIIGFIIKKCGG